MMIRISVYLPLFLHLGLSCSTASAQTCEERLDGMTGELEDLKRQVNQMGSLKRRVEEMETVLRDLSKHKRLLVSVDENLAHKVAFSTSLTKTVTLGNMQIVEYDRVLTNIGNGYDSRHGHFIAPVSGIYIFSCTVLNAGGQTTKLEMVKNGSQIGILYASTTSSESEQSSITVIVHLDKGDMVWIRHYVNENTTPQIYSTPSTPYNSFSGALLFKE